MGAKFEVFKDKSNQWRFRLKARNGKIIASSEGYIKKQSAIIGIKSVFRCANEATIVFK